MKAVVYKGPQSVSLADVDVPSPKEGEVLLRVQASGLCHTDLAILHGEYGNSTFPLIPGHEYAGVITKTGPCVTAFAVGDRVVVDPNLSCGHCRQCLHHRPNLCETLGAYGVTVNGGFAEFGVVRQQNILLIGDMPFERAALTEPMGCVLNGLNAVGASDIEKVLIFGGGPMGLLFAFALRSRGISRITVADINVKRLEMIEGLGFRVVVSKPTDITSLQRDMDLVVDTTGVADVAASLPNYLTAGGKALYFGICPPDSFVKISTFDIFRRQLTIAGSHSLPHNIQQSLDVIKNIGPAIDAVVSHRVEITEIPNILSTHLPSGALKVQAVWP